MFVRGVEGGGICGKSEAINSEWEGRKEVGLKVQGGGIANKMTGGVAGSERGRVGEGVEG